MSDNFSEVLAQYGGGLDYSDLAPHSSYVAPDWNGNLYAPINYTPAQSSYGGINTYVSPKDKEGAQKLNAEVIRAQYADYESRFQPLEDMATGLLTEKGTKDLPLELERTKQAIGGVVGNIQGQQERAMERFGQTSKARAIDTSPAAAGAMVGGLNKAVMDDEERRMKLLGGGTSAVSEAARGG